MHGETIKAKKNIFLMLEIFIHAMSVWG